MAATSVSIWAEPTTFTGEGHQLLVVAGLAAHSEKAVVQTAALQVVLELGVMARDQLIQQGLLGPVPYMGNRPQRYC